MVFPLKCIKMKIIIIENMLFSRADYMDQKSVPFLTDDHNHPSIVVESPDTRFIGMSNFSFF